MVHRHAFEAVDRTLRDIMKPVDAANEHKLFGGKVVVFGGDFRQVLPVVQRGLRGQIVAAAFNQSQSLWPHIEVHRLHENMRVQTLRAAGDAQPGCSGWVRALSPPALLLGRSTFACRTRLCVVGGSTRAHWKS
jgi:PIF1-like helicase